MRPREIVLWSVLLFLLTLRRNIRRNIFPHGCGGGHTFQILLLSVFSHAVRQSAPKLVPHNQRESTTQRVISSVLHINIDSQKLICKHKASIDIIYGLRAVQMLLVLYAARKHFLVIRKLNSINIFLTFVLKYNHPSQPKPSRGSRSRPTKAHWIQFSSRHKIYTYFPPLRILSPIIMSNTTQTHKQLFDTVWKTNPNNKSAYILWWIFV